MSAEEKAPTPWHIEIVADVQDGRTLSHVRAADGFIVMEIEADEPGEAPDLTVARRIVAAMNTFEAPTSGVQGRLPAGARVELPPLAMRLLSAEEAEEQREGGA